MRCYAFPYIFRDIRLKSVVSILALNPCILRPRVRPCYGILRYAAWRDLTWHGGRTTRNEYEYEYEYVYCSDYSTRTVRVALQHPTGYSIRYGRYGTLGNNESEKRNRIRHRRHESRDTKLYAMIPYAMLCVSEYLPIGTVPYHTRTRNERGTCFV